ncbi:hypothetical protein ACX3YG_14435 [Pseudomonas wadenswilerensis]
MHPAMQNRVDGLAAMRARTCLPPVDLRAMLGMPVEAQSQFQIQSKGKAFHIVDRTTGKTKGFCFSYRAAVNFADALEKAARSKLVPRP